MRALVTIRQIWKISEISDSDFLELAFVDGWQCVTKKGEFKAGDKAIYFEVDSFLPIDPRFEFLRKSCLRKMGDVEGFRLKSIRLRKQLSQGLLLPLAEFPEVAGKEAGEDVTELLKVVKWEPPIPACLAGEAKGTFPGFIMKTDEERCCDGETLLHTRRGTRTIRDVCEKGDDVEILSYNPDTKKKEFRWVTGHNIANNLNNWQKIILADGRELVLTSNHRVYLPDLDCYREVSALKVGDILLTE